ncbi:MAG: hypothetical protein D6772_00350 [Bacteroidetes bacterium]|nr:MAG: hypothetical protein D6772_00350 [Bacteroidota bacterium]
MKEKEHIREELDALGAQQLRTWQGRLAHPRVDAARLQAIAQAAQAEAQAGTPRVRKLPVSPAYRWRWAVAAAIVLAVGLAVWLLPLSPASDTDAVATEALSDTAILSYVEAHIEDFEWELLEHVLAEETTTALPLLDLLPDTAIESYLETESDWLEDAY